MSSGIPRVHVVPCFSCKHKLYFRLDRRMLSAPKHRSRAVSYPVATSNRREPDSILLFFYYSTCFVKATGIVGNPAVTPTFTSHSAPISPLPG